MVICVVIGCSKRSDRDKGISFYRIPTVVTSRSTKELELSQRRRRGFLSAISRADLSDKQACSSRICSRHFISGKPAYLFDDTHPDWLPTLHLGHNKRKVTDDQLVSSDQRHERATRRRKVQSNGTSAELDSEPSVEQQENELSMEQQQENELSM